MTIPPGQSYARNMTVVGYADLQGRPAFKLAIHKAGERWYLFTALLWDSGFNIIDVTDATKPRFVRHVEGPADTWTLQVQIAGTRMVTSMERVPPHWAKNPGAPFDEGFVIWDLADPEDPKRLGTWRTGGKGTHRNYYDGGRYVYATALFDDYDGHILAIVDIDDPANPVEISRWWRKGQWVGGGEGGVPKGTKLHGGAYVHGDRAYLPYSAGGFVILDISDKTQPAMISDLPFSPPFAANIAVHTAQPLTKRPLVVVNSEAIVENCDEPLGSSGIVDVSDEKNPRLISLFPLPLPPKEAPYRNFCQKGGRFGPHNQHQWQHQDVLLHDENLVFLTYFNAGLRVFDISDERAPIEIGYFIPPDPETRYGRYPATKLVCQTEDVVVDARGNIYISDKNHGIYILNLERKAAE